MISVGILAYGSLIEDPGREIQPVIERRIKGVETPFRIEFARKSKSRDDAPTVIPVENGGSHVRATILVLSPTVILETAKDMLWRRETDQMASGKKYTDSSAPSKNTVVIETLENLAGIDVVIYTKIGSNLSDPSSTVLAELAICSAKAEAGAKGKDGISYLLSLKRQSISTPLMPAYEREILTLTDASNLEDALHRCRSGNT